MGLEMRDLNQLILKFDYEQNFQDNDYYISKSNKQYIFIIKQLAKMGKNFLNISGEKFSGKSHLTNIFLKNSKA